MHLFSVKALATVVNAVFVVIKLFLEPGYEHPMKDHATTNIISSGGRKDTWEVFTAVGYYLDHTSLRPHLYQEVLQTLVRSVGGAATK